MFQHTPFTKKYAEQLDITLLQQRLSLYVSEWQSRRILMKGTWASVLSLPKTLDSLEMYVEDGYLEDQEHAKRGTHIGEYVTRLWRAVNLLDAVYMGWPDKELRTTTQLQFLDFKSRMATRYHEVLEIRRMEQRDNIRSWEWKTSTSYEKVQREWNEVPEGLRTLIVRDLKTRFANTVKRAAARYNDRCLLVALRDRLELFWFLEIVSPETATKLLNRHY